MSEEKELKDNVKQNTQLELARKIILLLTKIQCDSRRPTSTDGQTVFSGKNLQKFTLS